MAVKGRKSKIGSNIRLIFGLLYALSIIVTLSLYFIFQGAIQKNDSLPQDEAEYRIYLSCQTQIESLRSGINKSHGLVHMFGTFGFNSVIADNCRGVWNREIQSSMDSINKLVNIKVQLLRKDKAQQLIDDYQYYVKESIQTIQGLEFEIFSKERSSFTAEDGAIMNNINEDINKLDDTLKKFMEHFKVAPPVLVKQQSPISSYLLIISLILLLIAFVICGFLLRSWIVKPIIRLNSTMEDLSKGDIPEKFLTRNKDYYKISKSVNELSENLKNVKNIAKEVGKGEFDHEIKVFNDSGDLGLALAEMKESLKRVAIEDQQRNKVNEGLAKFSEILGNYTNDLNKFGDEVIFNLVKFLDANQGALFTVSEDEESENQLEIVACYAYNKKKYLNKKIKKGQGLVGQAWQEGKKIYITEVPDNYVSITSGLGYSTPRCILIVPLNFNDVTHGVIEIASFRELEQFELDFIEKAAESIASALASVKVNDRTQKLLSESKELTEQMRAQEEEMRQNMEELQATQEEMQRREDERIKEIDDLRLQLKSIENS